MECLRTVNGWVLLEKPKVRLVSFAASVVGLICYALSSTFNQLFGNWTWWKILLYVVFSFIICLAVFFSPARSRSRSTSLCEDVHSTFLVLTITCMYSYFCEKVVKDKPDAYICISYSAFATMSLAMLDLTKLRFWIDLLVSFCELLIIQLWMIKWWLAVVGGGFSYCFLLLLYYRSKKKGNEGDDPERVSSDSHVINMPQEGGIDSTQIGSLEDGQGHQLTQSISHPPDEVNLVKDEPSLEISRHPIKNAMKLKSDQADSISLTSSTRADSPRASPTRLEPTMADSPRASPTRLEPTMAVPTRADPTSDLLLELGDSKKSGRNYGRKGSKTSSFNDYNQNGDTLRESGSQNSFNNSGNGNIRKFSGKSIFTGNNQAKFNLLNNSANYKKKTI